MARPEDDIPDDDDAALFRAAIGPVTPLRAPARAAQVMPPRPRTRVAEREAHEVAGEFRRLLESHPQLEAGDHSSHRQPQVPHRILQRLRRGQYAIQDELDLHGAPRSRRTGCCAISSPMRASTAMAACASSTAKAVNRTARHRC